MKTRLSFFLVIPFLVTSCTDTNIHDLPSPEAERPYTEYEGIAILADDGIGVELGSTDQPEKSDFIRIGWGIGEHIYFVSSKYAFHPTESRLWGADGCNESEATPKELLLDDGEHWLYFEPDGAFWQCLETMNCDPEDEVFVFRLMVREVE